MIGIRPTTIQNKLTSMQYFTRMIKVDYVGFEPTTSAFLITLPLTRGSSVKAEHTGVTAFKQRIKLFLTLAQEIRNY
jgi:glycosylphosphatidylinositol transamidase (GPIT) subunit GPI8